VNEFETGKRGIVGLLMIRNEKSSEKLLHALSITHLPAAGREARLSVSSRTFSDISQRDL
jgi:hypothetical protein